MDNISIRKKRIMTYFIDAADEIMREEGIKGVTLRKVAKKQDLIVLPYIIILKILTI